MKVSYSFKNHFSKKTYIYLLGVGFVTLGVSLGVLLKTKLTAEEVFYVYVSCANNEIDKKKLENEFKPYFTEKIKEFKSYNESTIGQVYSSAGVNCDLLIVNESQLNNISYGIFAELPSEFSSANNYVSNEKPYGFMLFDGGNGRLTDAISYKNEKYYAFVNASSVHTIDFIDEGKSNIISSFLRQTNE